MAVPDRKQRRGSFAGSDLQKELLRQEAQCRRAEQEQQQQERQTARQVLQKKLGAAERALESETAEIETQVLELTAACKQHKQRKLLQKSQGPASDAGASSLKGVALASSKPAHGIAASAASGNSAPSSDAQQSLAGGASSVLQRDSHGQAGQHGSLQSIRCSPPARQAPPPPPPVLLKKGPGARKV